jgi:hypothetical protein
LKSDKGAIFLVLPLSHVFGDLLLRDMNIIQYSFVLLREKIMSERIKEVTG